jgi:cytochrome oxidase assembly protein ShyY1
VTGWRFAVNRRWFGYLAMAIVFAIGCVLLSRWQFDRREEALLEVTRIEQNYGATPLALTEALPELDSFDPDLKWAPVTVQGTYLVDEQLLVRNRPYAGRPGFEVLTPLLLDDGTVFIVDRGWVPHGGSQDLPDSVPAPPPGEVTVIAHLKASEPAIAGRTAPAGQMPTIQLDEVDRLLSQPVYTGAYGLLASESPAAESRPAPAPKPEPDEGPHLSYAVQWIVFALFGFGGLAYALRQEYRLVNADDPEQQRKAAVRRARSDSKRSDADIEDELLDAASENSGALGR